MKPRRDNWLLFLDLLPFLLWCLLFLCIIGWILKSEHEERKLLRQDELYIDSIKMEQTRLRHDPREDSLRTLEDSIHFYEDGY